MKTPERPFIRIPPDLGEKLKAIDAGPSLPVARVVDNSFGARKAKLGRELAELMAKLPLPVRLIYRAWGRLNRRKWERERQAERMREWAAFRVAMASILRDVEGSDVR